VAASRLYTLPERSRRRCTFEVEDLLGDDAQTEEQLTAPGGSAAFEVREKVRVRNDGEGEGEYP